MTLYDALEIIKQEKLQEPVINQIKYDNNIIGYGKKASNWSVYETDDRGVIYMEESCSSESDALEILIDWLRNQKIIEKYRVDSV